MDSNTNTLPDQRLAQPVVVSSDWLAVLGEDGWTSPGEPPDTDRTVQIAWDDMSYGPNSLGFYDGIAEIPDSGRRFWWSSPSGRGFHQLSAGSVSAWRERSFANKADITTSNP